jgi:hypothetical protein
MFRQNGGWRRTDFTFYQRFYPAEEVRELASRAGFETVRCYDPLADLGVDGPFGCGRGPSCSQDPRSPLSTRSGLCRRTILGQRQAGMRSSNLRGAVLRVRINELSRNSWPPARYAA